MNITADISDERGDAAQVVPLVLRDYGGRIAFGGPARTLRCDGDNTLLAGLLSAPGAGAVLVVDGGGRLDAALMGDVFASAAVENGWSGVIIHGAVRDAAVLAELPLGVKATGTCPRRGAKAGTGQVGVDLLFGDVRVADGDRIHADADGVLVIAAEGVIQ